MGKANVWVYDRWDEQVCKLDYIDATHTFSIDGDDQLEVRSVTRLEKRQRLVWRDADGWHEHEVDQVVETHDDDGVTCVAYCLNSLSETLRDHIDQRRPSRDVAYALGLALENSRWEVGECDPLPCSTSFYHQSARECVEKCVKASGGELVTEIETDGYRVTRRTVRVVARQGDQDSPLRFSWSRGDLMSVERNELADEVYSRVYPRGKGEETDTGGYGRRLTIESVNGGREYVEDAEAQARWGRHNGDGTMAPSCYEAVFEECSDPTELMELGLAELAYRNHPHVSYSFEATQAEGWGEARLGDAVAVIDHGFEPALRLRDRIVRMSRSLATGRATVELGEVYEPYVAREIAQAEEAASIQERSVGWDVAAEAGTGYASRLQTSINKVFEGGGSYIYQGASIGIIVADGTLDENGRPKTAKMAIQLKGGGFRISDTIRNGDFVWSTFGTGAGFYADEIVAGRLSGKDGKWWVDLDNGSANFDSSTTLSGDSPVTGTDAGSIAGIEDDRQVLIDQSGGTVRVGRADQDHLSLTRSSVTMEDSGGTKLMELLAAALSFYTGGALAMKLGTNSLEFHAGGSKVMDLNGSGLTFYAGGKTAAYFGSDGVILYQGGTKAIEIGSTVDVYAGGGLGLRVDSEGVSLYSGGNRNARFTRNGSTNLSVYGPMLQMGNFRLVADSSHMGMYVSSTGETAPYMTYLQMGQTSGELNGAKVYGELYGKHDGYTAAEIIAAAKSE